MLSGFFFSFPNCLASSPPLPLEMQCIHPLPMRQVFRGDLRGHPARKCRPRDGEKMREGHGLYIPFGCLPRRREGAPHHGIWTLSTPPSCGSMFDDRLPRPTSCHATRAEGAWSVCVWATVREGKGNMTACTQIRQFTAGCSGRRWRQQQPLPFKTCSAFGLLNMTSHMRSGGSVLGSNCDGVT